MDELEFRRRVYTDPNDIHPDFLSASTDHAANRQFLNEMKDFNHKLERAMNVPLPEDLPRTLMLAALPEQPKHREGPSWRYLAVAASVAFALGFATRFIHLPTEAVTGLPSIAQVALAHVHTEMPFTRNVDEQVTLIAANAKLEPYGARLGDISRVGRIYYANHCMFPGGTVAHLVIAGEYERINIFLVPMDRPLRIENRFVGQGLQGEVVQMQNYRLVIVTGMQENLSQVTGTVRASLEHVI
ncbi:DUF3379 family protein [Zobellella maritima]|uniref:DUF3379 family protein n=1 Tax=Zobellella maritima TaxID=2059725 RepID=UPI000E30221A|nr:DUF3379 family protein [Zobellella maritima]